MTCQQGLQFFPDRAATLIEMRPALRPGGQLGVAIWCAIEDCPPFAALANALGRVLGAEKATAYENGPWGFGDSDSLARIVEENGFTNVIVRRYELPLIFEGGPGQLLLTLTQPPWRRPSRNLPKRIDQHSPQQSKKPLNRSQWTEPCDHTPLRTS